jgi:di/tricarboxylate transporter
VVSWKQCLSDNQAWDTLTWFAALIAMAAYLNKFGFIGWFSNKVKCSFGGETMRLRKFPRSCRANQSRIESSVS